MVRKLLLIGGAVVLVFGLLLYAILAGLVLGSSRDAALQAVPKQVDAFYFAFVNSPRSATDILPESRWRLIGPITAMNGVLLFGWSTVVIYDVLRNVAQKPHAHINRSP